MINLFNPKWNLQLTDFDWDNEIRGTKKNNTLQGRDSNDLIKGRKGDDNLDGGYGHDVLRGGKGDDNLDGGYGHDVLGQFLCIAAARHDRWHGLFRCRALEYCNGWSASGGRVVQNATSGRASSYGFLGLVPR